jgi:excisionase family DNA binding protein
MADRTKFYTVSEAANHFGVDRRTISRWIKSGKIKAVVTPGGHHRILCQEIDHFLEQNGFLQKNVTGNTILVVDDDESVRETLKERLLREKLNVETASDGFKAGIKVRDVKPDLIILDLMMEGMDGFEVCRTIRGDSTLKKCKILLMTGFDTPENRDKAMREGVDEYSPKGVDFKILLEKISALLRK